MRRMTKAQLIRSVDGARIEQAIRRAEKKSSGEIRVSVTPFFWGSVRKAAEQAFDRLNLTQTTARNGVLIFVVPARKQFVILGDVGIQEKVGDAFWDRVRDGMQQSFREGKFTEGLERGIDEVGRALAEHFPPGANPDELPNAVEFT